MKRKTIRKRKSFRQAELSYIPMKEVDLPGMPAAPPAPPPPAKPDELVLVGDAARICARHVRALEIFLQVLGSHYPEGARAASILTFLPVGEKSVSATLTNLPQSDRQGELPKIHQFAYDCIAEYASNKKFKGHIACN